MLKNLLTILLFASLATGCSSLRPSASTPPAASAPSKARSGSSPEFISNISIKPDAHRDRTGSSIEPAITNKTSNTDKRPDYLSGAIENYPALQFKYAILEDARVEELDNAKLLSFMDYWYGTPYHYGGSSRDGIDCSAFAFLLVSSVYTVASLPRTAKEQFDATRRIRRDDLQEGDLVFFHTLGKRRAVTHVGVYLRNNKFIHASVSGVMISSMNDGYYDKHYIGAGRVLNQTSQTPVQQTQAVTGSW
ncbi:MAG TPA: C40 family peptidase [Puia sp.]|nr:C40 family peptidase [Puia sp.]